MKKIWLSMCFLWAFGGIAFAGSLVDHEHNKFDASDNVKIVAQTGTNVIGSVKDAGPHNTVILKAVDVAIVTDSIVWDPAVSKKAVITDIVISTGAANTVTLKEGANIILKAYLAANGGVSSNLRSPIKGAADANITVTTTAGNTAVELSGYEE